MATRKPGAEAAGGSAPTGTAAASDTANVALYSALLRHQTYLLRHSSYIRNRMIALLDRTEPIIGTILRDRLRGLTGLLKVADVKRLERVLKQVTTVRDEVWQTIYTNWLEDMAKLAETEAAAIASFVQLTAPVVLELHLPASRQLRAIALARPFHGRIMKEWAQSMKDDDIRRIHAAVRAGMIAGEGSDVIARRVIGTGVMNGADGVTEATRRNVAAVTRTAVQHIANSARREFFNENAEVLVGEQFVATLDSRTTPVCKANDGKVFDIGKGPLPPLHFNCRSLRIAAMDGERLGDRPAKPVTEKMLLREYEAETGIAAGKRADLPRGHKGAYDEFARKRIRELTGPVPAAETYQTWLKKQSKEFQDDTLGLTRAKLFRDGDLPLDRFVDVKGKELTLGQIAQRDAAAFRAAGLDPDNYR